MAIGLLLTTVVAIAISLTRSIFPENAMFVDNLCPLNDGWGDSESGPSGERVASQRERALKRYRTLDNPLMWFAEAVAYGWRRHVGSGAVPMDTKLVILVGMHHKAGSVLGRKLFASLCVRLRQCGHFMVTTSSTASVRRSLATPGVRVVVHPQWSWFPSQLVEPSRPYRFVHFWRHPVTKIASGYIYHKTGIERWTSNFVFTEGGGCSSLKIRPNEVFCSSLKVCRQCCVHVLSQGRGVRESPASATSSGQLHAQRKAALEAGRRAQRYLCTGSRSLPTGRTTLVSSEHFQGLLQRNGTLVSLLRASPLAEGLRLESALEFFENYRMAELVNHTRADPRALHVELDAIMDDFPRAVERILDFVGSPPTDRWLPGQAQQWSDWVRAHRGALSSDASVYDVSGGASFRGLAYTMLYRSSLYKHRADRTETMAVRAVAQRLLGTDPELRDLYSPVFDLLQLPMQRPL